MHNCSYISNRSTGYFSKLVLDYIDGDAKVNPFFSHPVSLQGIQQSIAARKAFDTPRQLLVDELLQQYEGISLTQQQQKNIDLLLKPTTFTICTAHQPNLFTGHLYFIYKILQTIKLANELNSQLPAYNFVPVYYMGSEDADLDELGHINLHGRKLEWTTTQTGAVGRMKVDKQLTALIDTMAGELEVEPYGKALIAMLRSAYKEGSTIQQATLLLVNDLFNEYGLLVLVPDSATLKQPFNAIVEREITEQFSHKLVEDTAAKLGEHYKVQAGGRELNLFYLINDKRERIEKLADNYTVPTLGLKWSLTEILAEVNQHPERFSANVILRGVFQETILPNIAFIGGGGEIAYWLELKKVFENCGVPYPMLIVRNSFLQFTGAQEEAAKKLQFSITDLFTPTDELVNQLVLRDSDSQLSLQQQIQQVADLYESLKQIASGIDPTLAVHAEALKVATVKKIIQLEKKMFRAEKRKFEAQQRQLTKLKAQLFPGNSLQERVDNFSPYFAKYGSAWITDLYNASQTFSQQFGLLEI